MIFTFKCNQNNLFATENIFHEKLLKNIRPVSLQSQTVYNNVCAYNV